MTWPGGSSSYKQVKWSALAGRNVILWPDADDPGIKAMDGLVEVLKKSKIKSIHILDISKQSGGWDVADAVAEGWGAKQVDTWTDENRKLIYLHHSVHLPQPQSTSNFSFKPNQTCPPFHLGFTHFWPGPVQDLNE